jgi:hypothetical protein
MRSGVMRKFTTLLGLLGLTACAAPIEPPEYYGPALPRFVVYYDDALPAETFAPYHLIVFDDVDHPPLQPLRDRKRVILGYMSLGEIRADKKDMIAQLQQAGALWGTNPIWKSHYVDITSPIWQHHLIFEQIPAILADGFDGVMLDTSDSVLDQGRRRKVNVYDPLVNLICSIKIAHPGIKVMLNRGFEVVPTVGNCIDYLLAESIYIHFDLASGDAKVYPQAQLEPSVSFLQQAAAKHQNLSVFTLDYWYPEDADGILRIYKKQRSWGFIPYVATPDLKRHLPEPVIRAVVIKGSNPK